MARFTPQILDEIRNRLTLSDIVGRRVTYDKRKSQPQKGDFWACCPFHNEKTPSFHVDDRRNIYHCFGCGVTGDHFRFLTEKEGLSFPEAVERLADEAGVELPKLDPREVEQAKKRGSLYDVVAFAQQFFLEQLQGPLGSAARGYLQKRGLSLETQREFGIGYAPRDRSALKQYLVSKGVEHDQMVEAGLVVAGPDIPVSYDKFRDRIMFPILDLRERVIAFGGRAMSADNPAKYMNSPETPLFSKRSVLYNAARARKVAHEHKRVIVVEGYMDVIALAQAGIHEAVAPLGTALTSEQIQLLWKFADEPTLCFDGDEAGLRAANRSADTLLPLLAAGKSAKLAFLADGKDPDDVVSEGGKTAFETIVSASLPLSEYVVRRHFSEESLETPERKAALEKLINDDIAQIPDKSISYYYRQHARTRLLQFFSANDNRFESDKFRKEAKKASLNLDGGAIDRLVLGTLVEFPWLLTEFDDQLSRFDSGNDAFVSFLKELQRIVNSSSEYLGVVDIYAQLPVAFHSVLHVVHGDPEMAVRRGEDVRIIATKRGYRLYNLFPGFKYEPDNVLVARTMDFFLKHLELRSTKDEVAEAASEGDVDRVLALKNDVERQEKSIDDDDEHLTMAYQFLKTEYQNTGRLPIAA